MASLFITLALLTKGNQPMSDRQGLQTLRTREQTSLELSRKPVVVSRLILNLRLKTKMMFAKKSGD